MGKTTTKKETLEARKLKNTQDLETSTSKNREDQNCCFSYEKSQQSGKPNRYEKPFFHCMRNLNFALLEKIWNFVF